MTLCDIFVTAFDSKSVILFCNASKDSIENRLSAEI